MSKITPPTPTTKQKKSSGRNKKESVNAWVERIMKQEKKINMLIALRVIDDLSRGYAPSAMIDYLREEINSL